VNSKVILLVEDNPDDEELTLLALKESNILNEIVVAYDADGAGLSPRHCPMRGCDLYACRSSSCSTSNSQGSKGWNAQTHAGRPAHTAHSGRCPDLVERRG
jgi:hypothetical protein